MNDHLWVIVGASSLIAKEFSHLAAATGADIMLVGRDQADLTLTASDLKIRYGIKAEVYQLDVTDLSHHQQLVTIAFKPQRIINLFVATAIQPDETTFISDTITQTMQTNLLAPMLLITHFLNANQDQLRQIVVLGSVAGDRGRANNFIYGASKAGLATFVQGLQARLVHSNINILLVKPGFIDTKLTYGKPRVFLVASPQACAQQCWKALDKRRHATIYFPWFWRVILLVIKHIPAKIFNRLGI